MEMIVVLICCYTYLELTDGAYALVQALYYRKYKKIIGFRLKLNKRKKKSIEENTNNRAVIKAATKTTILAVFLAAEILYIIKYEPSTLTTVIGCLVIGTLIMVALDERMRAIERNEDQSRGGRKDDDWLN